MTTTTATTTTTMTTTAMTTTATTTTSATTNRPRRGLSLIEVMIAAALLGLGVTAILSSFSTYTNIIAHQRHLLDAAFIAQSQLQRLVTLPPNHSDLTSGAHAGSNVDAGNVGVANGPFSVGWIVTRNKPTRNSREIRVVIGFADGKSFELVGLQP